MESPAVIDFRKLEVWFLTGSQHLYGPEALKQVEDDAKKIVEGLHEAGLPVKLVMKPVLTTPESIADLCAEANSAPRNFWGFLQNNRTAACVSLPLLNRFK